MEKCDILIVGAGVVGLAIADCLSTQFNTSSIIVVEIHDGFGRETSSRNSEVIHAGIYYQPGSLKARLCVEGRKLLYTELEAHGLPFRRLGKLIVATEPDEEELLEGLLVTAEKNGVTDITFLGRARLRELEPRVHATMALYSPSTGIFDTHAFMKHLETRAQNNGTLFAYNCQVVGINRNTSGFEVAVADVDGSEVIIGCSVVINCAGLHAHEIAAYAGVDCTAAGYTVYYAKGEYFRVNGPAAGAVSHLVYPPPGAASLGIHTVLDLQGQMKLGPNAFYVDTIDYTVDESHKVEFLAAGKKYLPVLDQGTLTPDMSGIRPKLQAPGDGFADFKIIEESARGLPGLINLIGIESPGLTSSLAIARYTAELLK
jgi:L-2-hydroxyglutarate oxidase LhgO